MNTPTGGQPPQGPEGQPWGQPGQQGQPPQGQPWGQQGQPWGQPGQQGQPPQGQPWGQQGPPQGPPPQGGLPWAGQVARGGVGPGPEGAPKPASSGLMKVLVPGALVVGGLSVLGLFLLSGGPVAEVGDCLAREADDSVSVVACDADDAQFQVAGVVEDVRPFQAQGACLAAYPEFTASYYAGSSGEPGTVLCLVDN